MVQALIKFTQDATVGVAGEAMLGDIDDPFDIENGDNAGIGSWLIEVLEVPFGSAVAVGILAQANSSTPTGQITPDEIGGCWRIQLTVWPLANQQGTPDRDIRCFGILGTNGFLAPPPQVWPIPLPDPRTGRPGAKPNECNFDGQDDGWAGSGADGLLRHLVRTVGAAGIAGPPGEIPIFDSPSGLTSGGLIAGQTYVGIIMTDTYLLDSRSQAGIDARCTHVDGCLITVADDADHDFEPGDKFKFHQWDVDGQVVIAGDGFTVRSSATLKSRAQYSDVELTYHGTPNIWVLDGDREL